MRVQIGLGFRISSMLEAVSTFFSLGRCIDHDDNERVGSADLAASGLMLLVHSALLSLSNLMF